MLGRNHGALAVFNNNGNNRNTSLCDLFPRASHCRRGSCPRVPLATGGRLISPTFSRDVSRHQDDYPLHPGRPVNPTVQQEVLSLLCNCWEMLQKHWQRPPPPTPPPPRPLPTRPTFLPLPPAFPPSPQALRQTNPTMLSEI